MKSIQQLLTVTACAAVLFAGCNKDSNGDNGDGEPKIYTVTVTDDGNGSAQADKKSAPEGTVVTLMATAKSGYAFNRWSCDDVTFTEGAAVNPGKFTMPAKDVSVRAEFTLPGYKIEVTSNAGGTVSADQATAGKGTLVTITAIPSDGYEFKQWNVVYLNAQLSSLTEPTATFSMPEDDVIIEAEFVMVGLVFGGSTWAITNVDMPGTFADRPEDPGMLYQWGKDVGWSSSDPMVDSYGYNIWDTQYYKGDSWGWNPCPEGWRVPGAGWVSGLTYNSTLEWTTLNGVPGMKCTHIKNGYSIFLPAVALRDYDNGRLSSIGTQCGYWTTQIDLTVSSDIRTTTAFFLISWPQGSLQYELRTIQRTFGVSVRCVVDS